MFQKWLDNRNDAKITNDLYEPMVAAMEKCGCDTCKEILKHKDHIVKRSQWIVGGDGASYDIGYGGLDHVIAYAPCINHGLKALNAGVTKAGQPCANRIPLLYSCYTLTIFLHFAYKTMYFDRFLPENLRMCKKSSIFA